MTEVKLPSLGVAIQDAKIVSWLKEEGEQVKKDEPIAEVETDKVTFEVVSPINGFLIKKLYSVDDLVQVNEALALVDEEKDKSISIEGKNDEHKKQKQNKEIDIDKEKIETSRKKITVKSTPAAKHIAKEKKLDLDKIIGSGPNGLISKDDVFKHLKQADSNEKDEIEKEEEVIPFEGVRKQIA